MSSSPHPVPNLPPSLGLRRGTRVGDWRVVKLLGQGAMARVYEVEHVADATKRALKVLKLPHESIRHRLLVEGRAQMRLRHPNIVAVHGIVEVGGSPGLIMDLVDGTDLRERLDQRALPLPEADKLARSVLEAMVYAHQQQVIHRDLKPANILLASGKVPRITDFGLARLVDAPDQDARATRSGVALGTPCYMAPEQIRNAKGVDERADVYSLGALLYELVSGQRAYPGDDMLQVLTAVAKGERIPLREAAPRAPSRMLEAVEGALAVDRAHRIPDVATLLAVWIGERRWSPLPARAASLAPTASSSGWTLALAVLPVPAMAGLAAIALGLVGVLGWMLWPSVQPPVAAPDPSSVAIWNEQGLLHPVRSERGRSHSRPGRTPATPSPGSTTQASPEPRPTAPAPSPPASAQLVLQGSYRSALLLGGGRQHRIDRPIPPGSYTLQATFHEGSVDELALTFRPGERVVVQCDPGWKECSRSSP